MPAFNNSSCAGRSCHRGAPSRSRRPSAGRLEIEHIVDPRDPSSNRDMDVRVGRAEPGQVGLAARPAAGSDTGHVEKQYMLDALLDRLARQKLGIRRRPPRPGAITGFPSKRSRLKMTRPPQLAQDFDQRLRRRSVSRPATSVQAELSSSRSEATEWPSRRPASMTR